LGEAVVGFRGGVQRFVVWNIQKFKGVPHVAPAHLQSYSFDVTDRGTGQTGNMLVENSGRDIVGFEQALGKVALLSSGKRRDRDKGVRHRNSPE